MNWVPHPVSLPCTLTF